MVTTAEQAASREAAADGLRRPDIELPGALRWLRRRLQGVYRALHLLRALMPDRLAGAGPTLVSFSACLGVAAVLLTLREVAAVHLAVLPAPLGFHPRLTCGGERSGHLQHPVGPDPPPGGA